MRTHFTLIFLVYLFFAAHGQEMKSGPEKSPLAQAFKDAGFGNLAREQSMSNGTLNTYNFTSAYLQEPRTMYVYVPACNDTSGCDQKTYPAVYFLHPSGFGKYGSNDLQALAFFGGFKLDMLIAEGKIQPMIAVFPDGSARRLGGSFYTNSDLYGPFENHIVAEVTGIVDGHFPTQKHRRRRGVLGHSMGGYGAMKLAFNHLDQYRAVASHSGPLDLALIPTLIDSVLAEYNEPPYFYSRFAGTFSELLFQMSGAFSPNLLNPPFYVDLPLDNSGHLIEPVFVKWLDHNPARLARPVKRGTELAIYFDVGKEDELGLFPFNQTFCDSLVALGLEFGRAFQYQPYEGGGHFEPSVILDRVGKSLVFMDSVLTLSYGCNSAATTVIAKQLTAIGFEPSDVAIEIETRIYNHYQNHIDDIYSILARHPEIQFELYHLLKDAKAFVNGASDGRNLQKQTQSDFVAVLKRLQVRAEDPGTKGFLRNITQVIEDTVGHATYEQFLAGVVTHLASNYENQPSKLGAASLSKYRLEQNYPNPFNPTTTVKIHLAEAANVHLSVYNVAGQKVATLVNQRLPAGEQSFTWNATGHTSGVYFVKLEAAETIQVRKMILMQ